MKKYLSLVTLSVASFASFSSSSFAKDGYFVQAFGGATLGGKSKASIYTAMDSFDITTPVAATIPAESSTESSTYTSSSAAIYGFAAGYNFQQFSTSLSLDRTKIDDGKITTALLNGAYNFNNSTKFTPFVGAGIGYTVGATSNTLSLRNTVAAQLQVGAKYAVHKKFDLFADVKYRMYGESLQDSSTESTTVDMSTYGGPSDVAVTDTLNSVKSRFFAVTAGISYNF